MQMVIDGQGTIHCLYAEVLDLTVFGPLSIRRASHVEPDVAGQWRADLSPVGGPMLGPFARRSDALSAEHDWLEKHWLARSTLESPT